MSCGGRGSLCQEETVGVRKKLLEEAARLEQLGEKCSQLADKAPLSASDREELHKAAQACRRLAAELKIAAARN